MRADTSRGAPGSSGRNTTAPHLAGDLHFHCAATEERRRWTGAPGLSGGGTGLQSFARCCMLTAVEETRHLQLQLDGVHVPDEKKEDHCLWQKEESPKEEAASPWSTRRTRSSKSPGDVTGGHHLPERAALGSSPPTAPALLLLQVRLQVLFGSHQPALHKREGLIRVLVEEGGCVSGISRSKLVAYLLLSQLQVRTGLVCEEPDTGHGSSHVVLSQ